MTAREAGLLLVSFGRFGFFDNSAASRQECGLFRRGLVSVPVRSDTHIFLLTQYDIFIRASIEGLVQALFEGLVFFLCSLVPDVCRYSFEDAVYLGRYRLHNNALTIMVALLFETHFSSRMWFSYPQPLSSLKVRFILADIATSLRECGLQSLAGSLREFRLDSFSADRLNSSPPSVTIAPPPTPNGAARRFSFQLDTVHMIWPAKMSYWVLHCLKQQYDPRRCRVLQAR
ncbi:hypothetical protein BO79DRAFT_233867 [Aspergillus costaricaensis CBS 115574]|uniref:Uncharacterized protein n=1 Tax=Aspergillus costaricaensis CBS 115574 TaxID=1448317 RepID=A0ACD1HXY4_9EURO|nr:hypothetical protein BO79DRAFT_233867 [Aspergillus costaricaensis CBS 115574]RAK82835.1 hypothetical protein BO79DRAFT_233867 [Aspergillus costaricaensis CBS 115574]